jgi:formate/nitrite transporter
MHKERQSDPNEERSHAALAKFLFSLSPEARFGVTGRRAHMDRPALYRSSAPSQQALLTPADGFEGAVAAGSAKSKMSPSKIFTLGMLSGAHIGFGAYLLLSVGGACPGIAASNPGLQKIIMGAFGLPFGLIMTLITGAELFTGNTALVTMAALNGQADSKGLANSWIYSYLGNFVGSLLFAKLVFAGGTLVNGGAALGVAAAKTSLSFKAAFVRGILCNWLVTMGVYMASMAKDFTGKMTAVWFPISAFVALGLEHSVANMFIIPLAIFNGAAISWKTFFMKNLLPVTLGNIVGGAVMVAGAFHLVYGKTD